MVHFAKLFSIFDKTMPFIDSELSIAIIGGGIGGLVPSTRTGILRLQKYLYFRVVTGTKSHRIWHKSTTFCSLDSTKLRSFYQHSKRPELRLPNYGITIDMAITSFLNLVEKRQDILYLNSRFTEACYMIYS